MTVGFLTLGCRVNQYDTQSMKEMLMNAGFEIADFDVCDIAIVNTCTVTAVADKKSRQVINRAVKRGARVVACGCLAQDDAKKLLNMGVFAVLGTNNKKNIIEIINFGNKEVTPLETVEDFEEMPIEYSFDRREAYIKIQDGCDNFCAYCKIPYVRGRSRSREFDSIIAEAERLKHKKTLVLTGIHIDDYLNSDKQLIHVIERVASAAPSSKIKLGSIHPKCFTADFLLRAKKIDNLVSEFHISLQSGCDSVLERMNRKYTTAQYFECLENIRSTFKNPIITTDIITGFSEETEEEHRAAIEFIKKCNFDKVHVFPYSKRTGTKGEHMPDLLTRAEKNRRCNEIIALFANLFD